MYKKRFAKWGFQKNSRRSTPSDATCCIEEKCARPVKVKQKPSEIRDVLGVSPRLSQKDALSLSFLTNVQNWNAAFFEPAFSGDSFSTLGLASPERAKETSCTLKLVSDLLLRGHGVLAGRLARKAFLLVEDILLLDGPALVWNLLEILYHMLMLGHEQLFCMLLSHLVALVNQQLSKSHPLAVMMRDLQRLAADTRSTTPTPRSSSSSSPQQSSAPPSPCASSNGTTSAFDSGVFYDVLSPLLKAAWTCNADIIFDNFDPRLFQLYFQLHWESCSINLPPTITMVAKQWLKHMETPQKFHNVKSANNAEVVVPEPFIHEKDVSQLLHAHKMDASPPQGYQMFLDANLAALWKHWESVSLEGTVSITMLRVMPSVVKARIIQSSATCFGSPGANSSDIPQTLRSQANNVACLVKALMELDADRDNAQIEALPGAIDRIKWILALREYAFGEIDPQVMQEMWLLGDALLATGEVEEAEDVRRGVISRINRYTQDVAIDVM
jgi:hypothetical protein